MITPAEASIRDLETSRTALFEEEVRTRNQHATLERAFSQAQIEVQRARNEIAKLQAQIEAEEGLGVKGFGLDDDEVRRLLDEMAVPVQLSLGVVEARSVEQTPSASPETLRRRVETLRSQLRHLGPVNPNAVHDYEEAVTRYTFLTSQSEDLEKAVTLAAPGHR